MSEWPEANALPRYRGALSESEPIQNAEYVVMMHHAYATARAAVNAMPKVRALVEAADDFVKAMEAMSLSGKEKIKLVSALAALKAKL